MDEMMQGHRGWRELHELGEKGQKLAGMLEGMVRSPKGGNSGRPWDGWSEEVKLLSLYGIKEVIFHGTNYICYTRTHLMGSNCLDVDNSESVCNYVRRGLQRVG
jgi:hypothetical protein